MQDSYRGWLNSWSRFHVLVDLHVIADSAIKKVSRLKFQIMEPFELFPKVLEKRMVIHCPALPP